jgi:hypothetical protein
MLEEESVRVKRMKKGPV